MVSLLERTLVYQALVEWLIKDVGIPGADIQGILESLRIAVARDNGLRGKLRIAAESALQSGEADYDLLLASLLAQWKPEGKAN
jgi:hypothetical protein